MGTLVCGGTRQVVPGHRHIRCRGYLLVAFSISLFFLLGVIGLAVDVGRMYVTKSEAQSFVDAAALNAAVKLAQSPGGFAGATAAAAATPKKWDFGNNAFTNVVTKYGTVPSDTFILNPPASGHTASQYTFAQVTARVSLPLYLIGVLVSSNTSSIAASAVAGGQAITGFAGGEFPFSPVTRSPRPDDATDPFGYHVGNQYTLRWAPPNKTSCGTDKSSDRGSAGNQWRGYCCVTGNNVPDILRALMLGEGTVPLKVGDPLPDPPGQKNSVDVEAYIRKDSDPNSGTYSAYKSLGLGNGKRVVIVPVNVNAATVVGFAAFFLPTPTGAADKNICGTYLGRLTQGAGLPPASGSGVYRLKLFK